jgi:hypothetical protein
MKQLLVEHNLFNYSPTNIHESVSDTSGNKAFIVEGILQRAGVKNQNGRIYPKPILEREISRYQKVEIAQRRALGELDHPESNVVNLRNVSHNILHVEWKGNDVFGRIQVLNTPSGNILKELFKEGVTLGISSRGMGSVRQLDESTVEVQNDFQLVGWDFVSNPSTQGAFVKPIMENIKIDNFTVDRYEYANTLIRDIICELSGVCCLK